MFCASRHFAFWLSGDLCDAISRQMGSCCFWCCRQEVCKARVVQHVKSSVAVIFVCLKARAEHPGAPLPWLSLWKGRSAARCMARDRQVVTGWHCPPRVKFYVEPSQGDQFMRAVRDTPAPPCCGMLECLLGNGWILEQLQNCSDLQKFLSACLGLLEDTMVPPCSLSPISSPVPGSTGDSEGQ